MSATRPSTHDATQAPRCDAAFLEQMNREGRAQLTRRRSWASYLPEFARRGLHQRDGCASIVEYAAKAGGLGPRTVHDVLRLEARIRAYAPLMRLFRGGIAPSKLQEVAPHLRSNQDARKFARWIEGGCTVKEIRARLVAQGYRSPTRLRLVAQRNPEPAPPPEPGPPSPSSTRGPDPKPATPNPQDGPSSAVHPPAGPLPNPNLEGDPLRVRVACLLSRAQAHMVAAARSLEQQLAGHTVPLATMLASYCEARLDHLTRLQAEGRLTEEDGLHPRRRNSGRPLAEPDRANSRDDSRTSPRERTRIPTLPRLGRRLAYVMVLHRNESTGRTRWRTRYGLLEVGESDLEGRTRIGEELDHDELHRAARDAAAAAPGDRVPTACEREVLLDSGGLCEHPGCDEWAEENHHEVRRFWRADHEGERLAYLCRAHHDLDHDPEGGDPDGPADEPDRARRRILRRARQAKGGTPGR